MSTPPSILLLWFGLAEPAVVVNELEAGVESVAFEHIADPVERWRPLLEQHFPAEEVETALCIVRHESGGDPAADNPRSSATGLFQFIESTWLEVMKSDGPRLGYQRYADAITVDSDGDYLIKDKALLNDIFWQAGRKEFRFIINSGVPFGLAIGFVQAGVYLFIPEWWVLPLFGLFVGAIPGLSATMAVALLVPATGFAQVSCTRDGLQRAVDLYISAQSKGDTSRMPLAAGLGYMENVAPADINKSVIRTPMNFSWGSTQKYVLKMPPHENVPTDATSAAIPRSVKTPKP